jgi:hypothetical protein
VQAVQAVQALLSLMAHVRVLEWLLPLLCC